MEFPSHPSGSKEHAANLVEASASTNQQVLVGDSGAAPAPVAHYATADHDRALAFIREATGAVAVRKNVPLTPEQIEFAAGLAANSLGAVALRSLAAEKRDFVPQIAAAIEHALDVLSAMRLITSLTEAAGFAAPEILDACARANAWLDYRPANDHAREMLVWPSLDDAMSQYARMRGSGPVRLTLPGRIVTRYFLDLAACRGKARADSVFLRLWRLNPFDDALPARAYGPQGFGPVVIRKTDGAVVTTWWRMGRLHRDPAEGPAQLIHRGDEVLCEYYVDGDLHRDAKDGPAILHTRCNGKEVAGEEYFEDGVWHRLSEEGPAVMHRDAAGRVVCEIYAEDGRAHRDSLRGPAWRETNDGVERTEYFWRGRFHRDPAHGPAVIERDGEGRTILEEFWTHGQQIEKPVSPRPNRRARRAARKSRKTRVVTSAASVGEGGAHA